MFMPRKRFQHYKGGIYEFLGEALHSETQERMAVYINVETGQTWARPWDMFFEHIEVNGVTRPRFESHS